MPGYQQIEVSRPSAFGTAGQDLARAAGSVADTHRAFDQAVQPVVSGSGWQGDSRDSAEKAAQRSGEPLRDLAADLRSARWPLESLGRSGEQGRAQLIQISGAARTAGYQVLPTGMVIIGPTQLQQIAAAGPAAPAVAEGYQLEAIVFTEELWAIMAWVSEVDVAAGEQLMALCARHGGPGSLPLSGHLTGHVFDGAWNNAGNRPVGYHHRPGGSDAGNPHGFAVNPTSVGSPDQNGVYQGTFVGVNTAGVSVNKRSTFFPDGWSEDDVRRATAGAFHSRHPVYEWTPPTSSNPTGRLAEVPGMWEGQYQGMTIRGYLLNPGQSGFRGRTVADAELDDVATAFPVRSGSAPYGRRN